MEDFSLADLWAAVRRQWVLIAGATVVVSVLAGARTYFMVPQEWSASTTIIFEQETSSAITSVAEVLYGGRELGTRGFAGTLNTIVRSRRIRERVAEKLNLMEVLEAKSIQGAAGQIAEMYETDITTSGVLTIRTTCEGEPKAYAPPPKEEPAAQLAASLANALQEALAEFLSEADYRRATHQRKFLEEQVRKSEAELLAAEDAVVAYATKFGLVDPSSQSGEVVQTYNELRRREGNLRVDVHGAQETEKAALERLGTQEQMTISSLSESRNPMLDGLHRRILDLQRDIAQQTEVQHKTHDHPDVQRLQAELQQAQAQLAEELSSELLINNRQLTVDPSYRELVSTALAKSLQRSNLEAQLEAVGAEKARVLEELATMPSVTAQHDHLQRQVRLKNEAFGRLSEKYETARLAEAASVDKFSVLDPAIPPSGPSAPSMKKSVVLTGFVTALLITLVAFWREARRQSASAPDAGADAQGP